MLEMAWNWLEWLKHAGACNVLLASYQADVDAHLLQWGVPCVDISEFVGVDPNGAGRRRPLAAARRPLATPCRPPAATSPPTRCTCAPACAQSCEPEVRADC